MHFFLLRSLIITISERRKTLCKNISQIRQESPVTSSHRMESLETRQQQGLHWWCLTRYFGVRSAIFRNAGVSSLWLRVTLPYRPIAQDLQRATSLSSQRLTSTKASSATVTACPVVSCHAPRIRGHAALQFIRRNCLRKANVIEFVSKFVQTRVDSTSRTTSCFLRITGMWVTDTDAVSKAFVVYWLVCMLLSTVVTETISNYSVAMPSRIILLNWCMPHFR